MNTFRTTVSIPPSRHLLQLKDAFLTAGSCFSDAIGNRLRDYKFQVLVNPFGTLYSPLAIHKALSYAAATAFPADETYLQNGDVYLNFDFHSSFSALDETTLRSRIENSVVSTHAQLKTARVLIITYGTAWLWEKKDSGEPVANCHKMPSAHFNKRLLTGDEILASFDSLFNQLKQVNPSIRIILTVSPVRHIRDTLPLNQVSKSLLRVACHHLADKYEDVEYFPAYEIMMDDLRDYRFYKPDMIHPTEQAEDYIWMRFIETYLTDDARRFIERWKAIRSALHHKPFHPTSSGHKIFLKDILEKLKEVESIVNVDEELKLINAQLDQSAHLNDGS
ncbi:MAG TPA: GSCFA domain-containing protein [Ohtaekwangia sp.]|nr:GSCFA domain-containing protein [Ohtaekwangia sp.]